MKLSIIMTKIHKWLALIVGIQLLLWVLGGLIMSWFPIETVRSEHNIREREFFTITTEDNLLSVGDVVESIGAITNLELKSILGMPAYQVVTAEGVTTLISADTGVVISPLN